MRRVVSIKQDLNQLLQYRLYHTWCHHGDHIRQSVNNDILLIDALRKLLPPYRGGDKLLYRGESAENYKRGTYGLSLARIFATVPLELTAHRRSPRRPSPTSGALASR